jgi:hypothetical protein
MLLAMIAATPFGLAGALPAFSHPAWLLWGAGVGLCSSVIPYVTDQLAMARLPRATFALMLALLPAAATIIGCSSCARCRPRRILPGSGWSWPGWRCTGTRGSESTIRRSNAGNADEVRAAWPRRAGGFPDLPGHDELRQP